MNSYSEKLKAYTIKFLTRESKLLEGKTFEPKIESKRLAGCLFIKLMDNTASEFSEMSTLTKKEIKELPKNPMLKTALIKVFSKEILKVLPEPVPNN